MEKARIRRLVGKTFSLYFKNSFSIVIIVLIISIPVEAIKNYYLFSSVNDGELFKVSAINRIISIVFLSIISPTIIYLIYNRILGEKVSVGNSLFVGLKKWPKIIVYGLLKHILILLGLVALIIPGIIFSLRLLFINIIVTLEDINGVFLRSKSLTKGILIKIILSTLLLSVIIVVPLILLMIVVYFIDYGWLGETVANVLLDLTWVLYIILYLLIYIEQIGCEKDEQNEKV